MLCFIVTGEEVKDERGRKRGKREERIICSKDVQVLRCPTPQVRINQGHKHPSVLRTSRSTKKKSPSDNPNFMLLLCAGVKLPHRLGLMKATISQEY